MANSGRISKRRAVGGLPDQRSIRESFGNAIEAGKGEGKPSSGEEDTSQNTLAERSIKRPRQFGCDD